MQWQTINDLDTLHESTGLYVIESQPGYFKDSKNVSNRWYIEYISYMM